MSKQSPENLLLYLAEPDRDYIDGLFAQLAQRGLPAQQQRPHISLTFAPRMSPAVVELAQQLLPPLIPATFRRAGTVVFGTKRKQTVAWLLETNAALEEAARSLSAANPDGRGPRWVPHLTMGLRLQREVVPDYIRALDQLTSPHFRELTAVEAAYWQPAHQRLHSIAKAAPPS
ncbi:2'-5' RNA ligase [Corynebacterium phocae]|uniref:2'-5' RNA ligase n=1 Tax=Corynebacterium phocae TaxID=161895 RepID=A0A1L7D4M6_9CORY|nr:2'-5' RNA ligase family protein [Corynebacterium phocae]APT93114.1 2'-5' RNA ligase [Corynebacterium phocae]KAA8722188.1 2'-5' RNA ligase family protein [Corynebacterium phocae]